MIARRSFLRSMLAACVAPMVFVPKWPDAHKWVVRKDSGLYTPQQNWAATIAFLKKETARIQHEFLMKRARNPDGPYEKPFYDHELAAAYNA